LQGRNFFNSKASHTNLPKIWHTRTDFYPGSHDAQQLVLGVFVVHLFTPNFFPNPGDNNTLHPAGQVMGDLAYPKAPISGTLLLTLLHFKKYIPFCGS